MSTNRPSILLYFLLAVATTTARTAHAQTGVMDSIRSDFDTCRSRVLQEKLFVRTDKPDYLAGEIIWFKVYCVEGSSHRPLGLSKVAYVDVLDKDDRFVLQARIALRRAEGEGSFYLPLTINSGNYKLRAYTNWMKNFGPDHFFEQPLTIINTLKTLPTTVPNPASNNAAGVASSPFAIDFFPEGGDLVNGIRSRVAFRAIDKQGRGEDCHGVIVDERRDTVTSFISRRFGIGQFWLTPSADHHYQAIVTLTGEGATSTASTTSTTSITSTAPTVSFLKDLPPARSDGYVMRVDGTAARRQLNVSVYARNVVSRDVYLFGRTGASHPFVRMEQLVHDSAAFLIDRDLLGEGVTQLTIFDGVNHPVCERLYFKRPVEPLGIAMRTDKDRYERRKKVDLSLTLPMASAASLSLAVYRLDSLGRSPAANIHSYLWLTSDLKGRIDSADAYFNLPDDEAAVAFDDLMLTHGWRRFHWETVHRLAARTAPALPNPIEYNGHILSGRLTDIRTGEPLVNRSATLSVPGVNYKFQYGKTDSTGKIFFDMRDYYGSTGVVLHSGSITDSPCKVEIFSPFSEQVGGDKLPPFDLSEDQANSLVRRSLGMQVENIYSGDSMQQFHPAVTDTLHFFGLPYRTYMLDDYTRFTTMEEVLREYVQEIGVNRPHGKLHVLMEDVLRREFFSDSSTLVLLDGVPVPDDKIFYYDPLKIKRLEIIPTRYFLGSSAFSGIASFTTYKGNYEGLELDRHSIFAEYEGLQYQREFYAPDYNSPEKAAGHLPDLRDLMFWAPDIHPDAKGKGSLSFYTSDLPGTYRIVVQGLTPAGRTCIAESEFEVK